MKSKTEKFRDELQPKGCWHFFTKCVGGMWSTREMENVKEIDSEEYSRTTIRELVIYLTFLIILCIMTFGMTSATQYYYSDIFQKIFRKDKNITTTRMFWDETLITTRQRGKFRAYLDPILPLIKRSLNSIRKVGQFLRFVGNFSRNILSFFLILNALYGIYLEKDFLNALHWEYKYNSGEAKNFVCPGGDEVVGPCPVAPVDRNILYESRLLGVPRLRQLRVKNGSCGIDNKMSNLIKSCYSEFKEDAIDEGSFNDSIKILNHTQHEAWNYQTEEELDGSPISGKVARYPGSGSIQNLSSMKNTSKLILKELKEGLWIRRGTRLVTIDFSVYNANINLFCIINMRFEFLATGGVLTSMTFHTVKLLRYVNPSDYFVLACEIVYICFIIYYIIEETIEIRDNDFSYFKNIWNILDITVISVSLANVFLIAYAIYTVEKTLGDLLSKPDEFANLTFLGFLATQTENALALCLFFSWIKLLKYITFNRTMIQLTRTLSKCSGDLLAFGFLFMIAFMGFAQFGYFLFGSRLEEFSTLTDSIFTLLRMILGDFNFPAMNEAEPFLGPTFFTVYVLTVFFVLLNMYLAIINDTYSEVKAEIAAQSMKYDVGDYIMRGYNNILGHLGHRNKNIDIENAIKISNLDGTISFDEIRQNLKKANFSDLEIEIFVSKYDHDGNLVFSTEEAEEILDDINTNQMEDDKNPNIECLDEGFSDLSITNDDMELLTKRIDQAEYQIGALVKKLDKVLSRMSQMKRQKKEKSDAMDEFFDPSRRFSIIPNVDSKQVIT